MTKTKVHTDEATSNKMRAVRQAGTAPEMSVRAAVESLGFEFAANVQDKPGRPDLWLLPQRMAVFVHGCFWHRHEGCKKATTPKRNHEYWETKFRQNVERDARKIRELEALGSLSIVVWQCETTDEAALRNVLSHRIESARKRKRP